MKKYSFSFSNRNLLKTIALKVVGKKGGGDEGAKLFYLFNGIHLSGKEYNSLFNQKKEPPSIYMD